MNLRKAFFQPGDQVEVILEWQVGMQAADNVEFGDGFGVARAGGVPDFFQRHGVRAGHVLLAAEGAQAAGGDADIGVIDVPVDVEVSRVTVHAFANVIGQPADCQDVARTIEGERVVDREPLLRHDLVTDRVQADIVGLERAKLFGRRSRHIPNDIAAGTTNHWETRLPPQQQIPGDEEQERHRDQAVHGEKCGVHPA